MANFTSTKAQLVAQGIVDDFTNGFLSVETTAASIAFLSINSISFATNFQNQQVIVTFDNVSTGTALASWVPSDGPLLLALYGVLSNNSSSQQILLEDSDYTLNRQEIVEGEPVELSSLSITIPFAFAF